MHMLSWGGVGATGTSKCLLLLEREREKRGGEPTADGVGATEDSRKGMLWRKLSLGMGL